MGGTDIAELGFRVDSQGFARAGANMDGMRKSAKGAESATDRLVKSLERAQRVLSSLGRGMSLYVTAPLTAAAAAAIKMGIEFGSTMAQMNTLVGVSREELKMFRGELLKLGPALGKTPTELADALFAITSAGQRGAEALGTLEAAAKASAIGLGDARAIALASTAAVQAYGAENLSAAESVEILVGTVEQGNLAAEELAPVLGRVIGIAAELGVEFQDVGAFIATFTRLGVNAAEATTALQGTLSSILRPSAEARAAFKSMEMSVEGFRAQIQNEGFTAAFQDLIQAARATNTDISALIPNVRALAGVLGVFGDGVTAGEVLQGVAGAVGTLEERFKALQELDPSFALQQFRAEASAVAIELSAELIPVFLEIVDAARELLTAFRELSPETKATVVQFAAIAAGIGPVLVGLAVLTASISTLLPLLAAMFGPVGLVVGGTAALLALAIALDDTGKRAAEMSAEVDKVIGSINGMTEAIQLQTLAELGIEISNATAEVSRLQAQIDSRRTTPPSRPPGRAGFELASLPDMQLMVLNRDLEEAQERAERLQGKAVELAAAMNAVKKAAGPAMTDLTKGSTRAAAMLSEANEMLREIKAQLDRTAKAQKVYNNLLRDLNGELDPVIAAQNEYADVLAELEQFERDGVNTAAGREAALRLYIQQIREIVEGLEEAKKAGDDWDPVAAFRGLEDIIDPSLVKLEQLALAMQDLQRLRDEGWIDDAMFDRMATGLERAIVGAVTLGDTLNAYGDAFGQMFSSLQDGTERGSEAYKVLELAIIASNMVSAIGAILNQAQGDPYSAPARMAIMAAIVSGLVGTAITLGSGGSGGMDLSADRQARLGTGSVLGNPDAVSESILKATEITADATSKLVNLNTSMLRALHDLTAAIEGSAREVNRALLSATFGELPKVSTSWLGGSNDVADLGIEINPITIGRILEGGFSNLFRDIGEQKHFFAGVNFSRETLPIPEGFEGAFAEVVLAMADVVREAALILGLSLEDVNQLISDFVVWEEDISFKDMNLEEQQQALTDYFSALFDGLAYDVVPFTESIRKIGEGWGEALIRAAASLQLVELAAEQMGFKWMQFVEDQWGSYADFIYRRAVDAAELVEMVGGVEDFIEAMTNFLQKFTPEAQQFELLAQGLADRLAEVGLVLPDTRQGFFDLMGTLDATTEAGREQIATLLGLVDNADAYYSYLEQAAEEAAREAERLASEMAQLYDNFFSLFASPEAQEAAAIATVVDAFAELGLSVPSTRQAFFDLVEGLDTATEEGMALYRTLLELAPAASAYYDILENVPEALDEIEQAFAGLLTELGIVRQYLAEALGPSTALVQLRDQFLEAMQAAEALGASNKEYALIMRAFDRQMQRMAAELTKRIIQLSQALFSTAVDDVATEFESGFDRIRTVSNSLFTEWQRALTNIKGFADSVLLDENLTNLNPRQQFNESRRQFESLLARTRSGDVDAANDLPGAAKAFLEEARFMFASGPQYDAIFREVQQALRGIQMPKGIEEYTREISENTANTVSAIRMQQDETVARLDKLLQAMDLSNALRDLGYTLDQNPIALAEELGVPLDKLAEALGIDLSDLSVETLMGIVNMAEMLGADLHDLGAALGIDIDALANQFGVMLDQIDFASQFMTQNDWNSAIYETLEQMEGYLAVIAGQNRVDSAIKDPRFKGGFPDEQTKIPKQPVTGLDTVGGVTTQQMTTELGEIKAVLTDMRDTSQQHFKITEQQGKELTNANVITADVLRRNTA